MSAVFWVQLTRRPGGVVICWIVLAQISRAPWCLVSACGNCPVLRASRGILWSILIIEEDGSVPSYILVHQMLSMPQLLFSWIPAHVLWMRRNTASQKLVSSTCAAGCDVLPHTFAAPVENFQAWQLPDSTKVCRWCQCHWQFCSGMQKLLVCRVWTCRVWSIG